MTGRLESVDFLIASAVFLGDSHGRWVSVNALLTVVGVAAAVLFPLIWQHHDPHGKVGYLYLVAGGWGYTLSLIITKRYLVPIPVGLLSLFKVRTHHITYYVLARLALPNTSIDPTQPLPPPHTQPKLIYSLPSGPFSFIASRGCNTRPPPREWP